jgi:hypothetical protein
MMDHGGDGGHAGALPPGELSRRDRRHQPNVVITFLSRPGCFTHRKMRLQQLSHVDFALLY